MPRVKTLSFVAEFPLQTTAADERTLDTRLNPRIRADGPSRFQTPHSRLGTIPCGCVGA